MRQADFKSERYHPHEWTHNMPEKFLDEASMERARKGVVPNRALQ